MTPAVNLVKKKKIRFSIHEYHHDANAQSYGLEAAEKLQLNPEQVFKTLVVQIDSQQLVVGIVPVTGQLNMKQIAKAAKAKKAAMAAPHDVERATGYILGGVSPLGQKKSLLTCIDSSALQFETIFVSGGKRGLEIELTPKDLAMLTRGQFAEIASR